MSLWSSLDTAFAALLLGSLVWGWWRGLVYEVLAIVNWLVAAVLTSWLAPMVADAIPFLAGTGLLAVAVRYVVIFVAFIFVGGFLASVIRRLIAGSGLRPADRSLGAVFGLLRGVVALFVIVYAVTAFGFQSETWWTSSIVADLLNGWLQLLKPMLPKGLERLLP